MKAKTKWAEGSKWTGGRDLAQGNHRMSPGVSKAVEPVAQSWEEMAGETGSGSHTN